MSMGKLLGGKWELSGRQFPLQREEDLPRVSLGCSPHHRASNTRGVTKIPNPHVAQDAPKGSLGANEAAASFPKGVFLCSEMDSAPQPSSCVDPKLPRSLKERCHPAGQIGNEGCGQAPSAFQFLASNLIPALFPRREIRLHSLRRPLPAQQQQLLRVREQQLQRLQLGQQRLGMSWGHSDTNPKRAPPPSPCSAVSLPLLNPLLSGHGGQVLSPLSFSDLFFIFIF